MGATISQERGHVPVTILHLAGRINLSNAEEIEKQTRAIFASGARDLLLDLAQVESITSAGLRAILAAVKLFGGNSKDGKARSAHVKLLSPAPLVQQVLTIAGFDEFMDIYNDRQEAINSF